MRNDRISTPQYGAHQLLPMHPSKPKSKKWITPSVLILVGMIIAIITIFLAWFSLNENGTISTGLSDSINVSLDCDFGLNSIAVSGTMDGIPISGTMSYDAVQSMMGSLFPSGTMSQVNALFNTFGVTQLIMIIGIIMAILAMILVIVAGLTGKIPGYIGGLFGVIGSVLVLTAALYLMLALPSLMGPDMQGFWGSQTFTLAGTNISMTWGAGIGWYMAIVAFVVLLIGAVMAYSIKKAPSAVGSQQMQLYQPGLTQYEQPPPTSGPPPGQ